MQGRPHNLAMSLLNSPTQDDTQAVRALTNVDASACFAKGLACHEAGHFAQAQDFYRQALALQADHFDSLHAMGVALAQGKAPAEALIWFDKAIAVRPAYALAHTHRGNALTELERVDEALVSYDQAIALKPNHADSHYNRGIALQSVRRLEQAIASYDRAITLRPHHADYHYNRATAYQDLQQIERALAAFEQAIRLQPRHAQSHYGRGICLRNLNRLEEALRSYDEAIAIDPSFAEAYSNRGNLLIDLRRIPEAVFSFEKAIALKPDYAAARWNLSLAWLLVGEFRQGWALYEWRWQGGALTPRKMPAPLWLGEKDLRGQSILLYAEQGYGDTIQFCRYARQVKALGARVIMEVPSPLRTLLQGLEGVDEWVVQGQALPAVQFQCPLLSLPLALKTNASTIPQPSPYLWADPQKTKDWAQSLGEKTRPRIGLVWRGSAVHKNDRLRSLALDAFLPYLPADWAYVSLQKEIQEHERIRLDQRGIPHFGEALHDFSDTAALCANMDLVVSVDTSVAHLAAALGRPTWILLAQSPDWRWLLDRADSPWYPTVRLFRQGPQRDWAEVVERVAQALSEFNPSCALGQPSSVLQAPEPSPSVEATFREGLRHHHQGQSIEAQQKYEAVLAQNPDHFDAHHMLAVLAVQLGDPEKGLERIDLALRLSPHFAPAHSNRGGILATLRRHAEALLSFDRAIERQPNAADTWYNRGIALRELGRLEEAIASVEKAIAFKPDYLDAHFNLGLMRVQRKDWPGAIAALDQTLSIRPAHAEAHFTRANALKGLNRMTEAIAGYKQALAIKPDHVEALYNMGNTHLTLEQMPQAVECFEQVLAIEPRHANACLNLGNALRFLKRLEESAHSYQRATAINPNYAQAHSNLGVAWQEMGRLDDAMRCYEIAARIQPDFVEAKMNMSLIHLLRGEFASGFSLYEWRWQAGQVESRDFLKPLWQGEDLRGKTLLLHAEQGLGDTLQFCRYAPLLQKRGARVILEVQKTLHGLMQSLRGVDVLCAQGEPLPDFDFHCPMLSIALAMETTVETIPNPGPYLFVDPAQRLAWAHRLGERRSPRIGLAWRGNPKHGNDRNRSMSLEELALALPKGLGYVSLQKDVLPHEQALLERFHIRSFAPEIQNFRDTAALCEAMDAVICVDTSIAHLGGALGVKTWVLLPHVPDWRWLLNRQDSPWYDSVRLYRQDVDRQWAPLMQRVAKDLESMGG